MRLLNQRFPALLKRTNRPGIWQMAGALSLSLIFVGCAGGSSGGISNIFGSASPTPTATPAPAPTPVAAASPTAAETNGHPSKRTARQARAASENAAAAAAAAAQASKQAATASRQAASVANTLEGRGPTNADVSLENGAGTTSAAAGALGGTPAASPSAPASGASVASVARDTPSLNPSALDSSPSGDANPARAAKLVDEVDKIESRVDRKNLTADDSQRDILAQRLIQEAKKSLADHDSVAAISLATKASTLLEPLPKFANSSLPSAP